MASGGKRGAGERVLESKHVIGLFLLMLLFSGAFFALGYVMARDQYGGQVRAAGVTSRPSEAFVPEQKEAAPAKTVETPPSASETDPATSTSSSGWEFPNTSKPPKSEPRLQPVPKAPVTAPVSKPVSTKPVSAQPAASAPISSAKNSKSTASEPQISSGAFVLQVMAITSQDEALATADTLQKKHYAAYVLRPQKDKFYRVQVGPFKDKKAAEAAKKGLEGEGFKAFYVTH